MSPRAILLTTIKKVPGISPTDEKNGNFMANLSKCAVKPVALRLVHPYADQFILKSRNTVPDLFSSDNLELSYPELLNNVMKWN